MGTLGIAGRATVRRGASPTTPTDQRPADAGEQAWEFYSGEDWQRAVDFLGHPEGRANAIGVLAGLELADRNAPALAARTVAQLDGAALGFADLIVGMRAHHSGDLELCARHVGRWLLAHDFFAVWILERFVRAAEASASHALLFGVCAKFLKRKSARATVVGPAISAAHALEKHKEAVLLFRTYRELVDEPLLLQKAAFSMLHIKEHADAEDLLVALYQRVAGRPYAQEPERFEARRAEAITRVAELRTRTSLSLDEERDLGMSLLFLGKSAEALRVLEHSLARTLKQSGRRPAI